MFQLQMCTTNFIRLYTDNQLSWQRWVFALKLFTIGILPAYMRYRLVGKDNLQMVPSLECEAGA